MWRRPWSREQGTALSWVILWGDFLGFFGRWYFLRFFSCGNLLCGMTKPKALKIPNNFFFFLSVVKRFVSDNHKISIFLLHIKMIYSEKPSRWVHLTSSSFSSAKKITGDDRSFWDPVKMPKNFVLFWSVEPFFFTLTITHFRFFPSI